MSTFDDLVESIHSALHSYSGVTEQLTWLTESCTDSDLNLTVASSDSVMRGLTEIDDELIYVDTSDSNGLTVAPFGRGFRGTTAAAHAANAQVTFDPAFPRVEIKKAIQSVMDGLFPMLYQIKTHTFTYDVSKIGFDLPADVESVLEVKWEVPDVLNHWETVSRWAFDPDSPTADSNALVITDYIFPSSEVQVVYRARFGTFAAGSDTLGSVGLDESYSDLILYGVTARMVRFLDPARLAIPSAENVSRAAYVQAGEAGRVADKLYAMYQQRLMEERRRLLELAPPSIHFTR